MKNILLLLFITYSGFATADNFFEQRYRGWLWFEERERQEALEKKQQEQIKQERIKQQQEKAKQEVKQFSKELKALRYMMIRYPEDIKHVLAYKKKEGEMLEMSLKLDHSYRMANFINPDHIDLLENPINLYGRKIKKEIDKKSQQEKVRQLASQIELFLIYSESCPYCQEIEPVLAKFAQKYNFKIEAVSMDNSNSKYFKTHHNPALIAKLEVTTTPTIIAVTNDSSVRFEFMRGAVSISELEERAILALEFMDNLKNAKENTNEQNKRQMVRNNHQISNRD